MADLDNLNSLLDEISALNSAPAGAAGPPAADVPSEPQAAAAGDGAVRGLQAKLLVRYGARTALLGQNGRFVRCAEGVDCEGSGAGAAAETFVWAAPRARSDPSEGAAPGGAAGDPVLYGDTVALRNRQRRDKCLSCGPEGSVELLRAAAGQSERWTVWPFDALLNKSAPGGAATSAMDDLLEGLPTGENADAHALRQWRGRPISSGDAVALLSYSGRVLCLSNAESAGPADPSAALGAADPADLAGAGARRLCAFQVLLAGAPHCPAWKTAGSVTTLRADGGAPAAPLSSFGVSAQEALLVQDLLHVLLGAPGRYVSLRGGGGGEIQTGSGGKEAAAFEVDPCDPSLGVLAARVAPCGLAYKRVEGLCRRLERHEFGLCAQALAARARALLQEYLIVVAQLESEQKGSRLSLQRLWFLLQPALRALHALRALLCEVDARGATGGQLLNVLHDALLRSGDGGEKALLESLMFAASAPYFGMLSKWVFSGVLNDPYDEFLVRCDGAPAQEGAAGGRGAAQWERRYAVEPSRVPFCLQSAAGAVLTAGRYLNSVRECGRDIECPFACELSLAMGEGAYLPLIHRAAAFASNTLLKLLLVEHRLAERLQTIKRYFLLEAGDFLGGFLDIAQQELRKEVSRIRRPRVQQLLNVCLLDAHRDSVMAAFASRNLLQHLDAIHQYGDAAPAPEVGRLVYDTADLKGLEAFVLDMEVPWPVNMVLSRRAMAKYQLLFRHLFYCKHVERALFGTWRRHQGVKELRIGATLRAGFALRHRMLHLMQNLVYYMMVEVVEPRWHRLLEQVYSARDVDELLQRHGDFQDGCLKDCLLTQQSLLGTLYKLMDSCLLFAAFEERFAEGRDFDEVHLRQENSAAARQQELHATRQGRIAEQSELVADEAAQPGYVSAVARFERKFDGLVEKFMAALNDAQELSAPDHAANLLIRLDFNSVITAKLH